MTARRSIVVLLLTLLAAPAAAQSGSPMSGPFAGSVPQGTATADPLPLSMGDALTRGLQFNLGLLLQEESRRGSSGARKRALAELLPNVRASARESRQVINLEAYGFPAPDPIVGPFNVFDARVGVSQRLFDLAALKDSRAAGLIEHAETLGVRSARELVVLVTVNLYLEAVSASSRIEVAKAQHETAEALFRQASNLKDSGLVAGIDVVRAQVQVQRQRQKQIVAENDFEKAKLQLSRAIGLPPGQPIVLTDKVPFEPMQPVELDKALADAYAQRADYLAARDRLAAAETSAAAVSAQHLPSVTLDADYGTIGQTLPNAHPTYTMAANVRVPIWEGGRVQAKRTEAEAVLRQRRAELEDFRGRIDLEVRSAYLDVRAATQQIDTTQTTVTLANQELTQARDRFAAGVASNIEVTQAQESVAEASEAYIDALYHHNVAKAMLARAVGVAETAVTAFLSGVK